jgi:hypothetical protein
MEAGDGGRNGQRVDVGSAGRVEADRDTHEYVAAERERADGGLHGQQRDCGVFGSAWVLGLHVLPYNH